MALTVLTIAVLALIGLYATVFSAGRRSVYASVALYDMESEMDALLKANNYVSTVTVIPAGGSPPLGMPNGTLSYIGSSIASRKPQLITVTVTWVEAGHVRSVSLQSEVAP